MKKIDDLKEKELITSSEKTTNQRKKEVFLNRKRSKSIRQGNR